jgi:hypothetical protein
LSISKRESVFKKKADFLIFLGDFAGKKRRRTKERRRFEKIAQLGRLANGERDQKTPLREYP